MSAFSKDDNTRTAKKSEEEEKDSFMVLTKLSYSVLNTFNLSTPLFLSNTHFHCALQLDKSLSDDHRYCVNMKGGLIGCDHLQDLSGMASCGEG